MTNRALIKLEERLEELRLATISEPWPEQSTCWDGE